MRQFNCRQFSPLASKLRELHDGERQTAQDHDALDQLGNIGSVAEGHPRLPYANDSRRASARRVYWSSVL